MERSSQNTASPRSVAIGLRHQRQERRSAHAAAGDLPPLAVAVWMQRWIGALPAVKDPDPGQIAAAGALTGTGPDLPPLEGDRRHQERQTTYGVKVCELPCWLRTRAVHPVVPLRLDPFSSTCIPVVVNPPPMLTPLPQVAVALALPVAGHDVLDPDTTVIVTDPLPPGTAQV